MSVDPNTLGSLMARLAQGERAAFAPVFRILWGPLLGFCLSLVRNEADASDAAQEAMKKILERASEYDIARPAMPWAMAIASWECRTLTRRSARRREGKVRPHELAGEQTEEAIVRRNLAAAAVHALGELSENDREALTATFWEEALTFSGATLRKRRARALDRLRVNFKRQYVLD